MGWVCGCRWLVAVWLHSWANSPVGGHWEGKELSFLAPHGHITGHVPCIGVFLPAGKGLGIVLCHSWSPRLVSPVLGLLPPRPQTSSLPWQGEAQKHSAPGIPGLSHPEAWLLFPPVALVPWV